MNEQREPQGGGAVTLEEQVRRAQRGNAAALEAVVKAIQDRVCSLNPLRFLWHPQDAEDATQEILLRIITRLGGFRGESAFTTWVYRVACNALLTMRKSRAEERRLSFDEFAEDLTRGFADEPVADFPDIEKELLLEEVKIGCTTAMLLCLDRAHRLAYVLGEILQLDHNEASQILEISRSNFRQRVSRARKRITDLMARRCGLFDPANPCRCRKRVNAAVELGRVDPQRLLFVRSASRAREFPRVLEEIRRLDELARAAALYRSHPEGSASTDLAAWLKELIRRSDPRLGDWARES